MPVCLCRPISAVSDLSMRGGLGHHRAKVVKMETRFRLLLLTQISECWDGILGDSSWGWSGPPARTWPLRVGALWVYG